MKHMIVGILLSLGALPLAADPKTDADYIVSQVASIEVFDSAIKAQAPIMKSAIENDLRKKGITLSDIDVFFDIFFDEFLELFVEKMQARTAQLYVDIFSPQELSDLAAFYKSESGQALIAKTPTIIQASTEIGQIAGMETGVEVNARVMERLEAEGESMGMDQSVMDKIRDALR